MKLYWRARTRASRAVWMLEGAGVDPERPAVDLRQLVEARDPAFVASSPTAQVPTLEAAHGLR